MLDPISAAAYEVETLLETVIADRDRRHGDGALGPVVNTPAGPAVPVVVVNAPGAGRAAGAAAAPRRRTVGEVIADFARGWWHDVGPDAEALFDYLVPRYLAYNAIAEATELSPEEERLVQQQLRQMAREVKEERLRQERQLQRELREIARRRARQR